MKSVTPPPLRSSFSAARPWLSAAICLVVAAILQSFSFPGEALPWLAWLAFLPLFASLHLGSPKVSFFTWGTFQALTFAIGGLWTRHFMTQSLGLEPWKALLVVIACCVWSGIPHAFFGWIATRYRLCETVFGTLGAAALLALLVAIFPYPFPCDQSLTQYRQTRIIQIVEIGGRELLYFCIVAVNGLLFLAIRRVVRHELGIWKPLAGCLIIAGLVLGYGTIRLRALDSNSSDPISIGVVQAAVPPKTVFGKHNDFPADYKPGSLRVRPMSRNLVEQQKIDLIIWPELPVVISYQSGTPDREQIKEAVRETGVPLLFCTFEADANPAIESERQAGFEGRQISYLIEPNGIEAKSAVKQNLVPFGETLPFEKTLPWLRSFFPNVGRMRTEGVQAPLELSRGNVRIGPLICYDDMFTSTSRHFADQGANLLVTQANDSWFGNNSSLDWRLASATFRTVETRLPWVRVGNSGYTLNADRSGRIHWENQLPVFERAIDIFEITAGDPTISFYPHTIWPSRFGLAGLAVWALILGKRHRSSQGKSYRTARP